MLFMVSNHHYFVPDSCILKLLMAVLYRIFNWILCKIMKCEDLEICFFLGKLVCIAGKKKQVSLKT